MKRIKTAYLIKTIMLTCLICTVNVTLFAQKEYVYVCMTISGYKVKGMTMSGKLPEKMQLYNYDDVNVIDDNNIEYTYHENTDSNLSIGFVLNELSANGFEMVFMNNEFWMNNERSYLTDRVYYVFSRDSSSSPTTIKQINQYNESEEVKEVARYNLQGLPVRAHEKGVQIIVYSNYTTKTILVQ